MTRIAKIVTALGLTATKGRRDDASAPALCHSYGMDFQSGGYYFQNSLSNDNFTFVEQFQGCNPDVAYNIIVDPQGNQNMCTDTQLTPGDTDMLSICPLAKSQLVTGNWSIIVISNNGKGAPLAAQRDFMLSVGPQLTSTVTPTVTATQTSTPIVSTTVIRTVTSTTTLPPKTVIVPTATMTPTTTVTPKPSTKTTTKAVLTLDVPTYTFAVVPVTVTETASCALPTRPPRFDPRAIIMPTIGLGVDIIASIGLDFPHAAGKERFIQERAERLALVGRAPDPQPLFVTETNTKNWRTVTVTSLGPAVTATVTQPYTTAATSTPSPVTIGFGIRTEMMRTVTAPTPTVTATKYIVATLGGTTETLYHTYTVTATTTPYYIAASCTAAGGILY